MEIKFKGNGRGIFVKMDNKNNQISESELNKTIDEIQEIMNGMDKRTFHSNTSMEWEGSIQNAPKKHTYTSEPEIPDCGCIYG